MKTAPTATVIGIAAAALATTTLTGCIIVDTDSNDAAHRYARIDSDDFTAVVAHNRSLRLGDARTHVLGGFPAENTTLVTAFEGQANDSSLTAHEVYRVHVKDRSRNVYFRRYYVFNNGTLALISDDRKDTERFLGIRD